MLAQPMDFPAAGRTATMAAHMISGTSVQLVPPAMHWALVLVLGSVTFGIFYIIWVFKQANFVKRIDPSNPASNLFKIMILLLVAYIAVLTGAAFTQSTALIATVGAAGGLLDLVMVAINLIAVFKMRASLLNYYNTVEPIGLRLSGAMTFFFNILYFQYHFQRIAQWKQSGVLTPQK
jgi:hypothetical protein